MAGAGAAKTKKDAEVLACMDANNLIEQLGINVHEIVAPKPVKSHVKASSSADSITR